mgnify:FL=1
MSCSSGAKPRWGDEEVERLKAMLEDRLAPKQAARALGRSLYSVYWKLQSLGVRSASRWTDEDDDELARLAEGGLTAKEIGARIGRSANSVSIRMSKLGIRSASRHSYDWGRVARMVESGCPDADVAEAEGVPLNLMRSAFHGHFGVTMSKMRGESARSHG